MGRWDYDDWYTSYTPSKPREAKNGIKTQGKGKTFGSNWWAKRWNQTLEQFNLGARLSRGRSYAKSGQVLSVEIKSGSVLARVQGTRVKPYKVVINVKTLTPEEWDKVTTHLSQEAIFTAKLLAGEMPPEIEKVFTRVGVSLFPDRSNDLETDCSCPDWSNPCKHIAAVYYILGQEFDRDPFLIFKLRGMERENLLARLGATEQGALAHPENEDNSMKSSPLSVDPSDYWEGGQLPVDFLADTALPPVRAALLRQLGNFPFWCGQEDLQKALEPVYKKVAETGLSLVADSAP